MLQVRMVATFGGACDWRDMQVSFWGAEDVLFLDLGVGGMGVLRLRKFIELHPYDLCPFVSIC